MFFAAAETSRGLESVPTTRKMIRYFITADCRRETKSLAESLRVCFTLPDYITRPLWTKSYASRVMLHTSYNQYSIAAAVVVERRTIDLLLLYIECEKGKREKRDRGSASAAA